MSGSAKRLTGAIVRGRRTSLLVAVIFGLSLPGYCQGPIVFPGGVVSAASYATGGASGDGIAPGSLAVVFGVNLAEATLSPDPLLVPTRLGGATVTVGGVAAPLLYVSPSQIVFQMPIRVSGPTTVVVATNNGASTPYRINAADAFGVFTRDSGGCGGADAMYSGRDGLSLNSPSDSISPGDILAIFGTGLFPISPAPPDGVPAPSDPLGKYTGDAGSTAFDVDGPRSPHLWAGVAPGLVGVHQINVRVPENVREGCSVPMLVTTGGSGNSKPVTISVHRGGGQCVDPPAAGYGRIEWVKTITTGAGADTVTDAVTISMQAWPGRGKPPDPVFVRGAPAVTGYQGFGRECPVPGYRSLDGGAITVKGPGFGPLDPAPVPLGPPANGQVAGLTQFRAVLPRGTIQPGLFQVVAGGGADVAGFQTEVPIGAGVEITTPLVSGTLLHRQSPVTVTWTGGDPDAWVTMKVVVHRGAYDQYWSIQAPASDGVISMPAETLSSIPVGPIEVVVEVDPQRGVRFESSGLSLGGAHTWKYVNRFAGLTLE